MLYIDVVFHRSLRISPMVSRFMHHSRLTRLFAGAVLSIFVSCSSGVNGTRGFPHGGGGSIGPEWLGEIEHEMEPCRRIAALDSVYRGELPDFFISRYDTIGVDELNEIKFFLVRNVVRITNHAGVFIEEGGGKIVYDLEPAEYSETIREYRRILDCSDGQ